MLSLLLTLFISLFSFGSPIDSIEDHKEDNIKQSANFEGTFYYSNSDFLGQSALMTWTRYLDNNQLGDSNGKWDIFNHDLNIEQSVFYSYNFVNNNTFYYIDTGNGNVGTDVKYLNQVRFTKTKRNTQYDLYQLQFMSADYPVLSINYLLFHDINEEQLTHDGYTSNILTGILINNEMSSSYSSNYINKGVLVSNRYSDPFIYNVFNASYYSTDYNAGYNYGYEDGKSYGYDDGVSEGYQLGYGDGYNDASNLDSTASTIFTGIFDVGLLPVNVFLTIFNFDIFGVNIAGIVSGLLTLAVVVVILRFLLGGKKDD